MKPPLTPIEPQTPDTAFSKDSTRTQGKNKHQEHNKQTSLKEAKAESASPARTNQSTKAQFKVVFMSTKKTQN